MNLNNTKRQRRQILRYFVIAFLINLLFYIFVKYCLFDMDLLLINVIMTYVLYNLLYMLYVKN